MLPRFALFRRKAFRVSSTADLFLGGYLFSEFTTEVGLAILYSVNLGYICVFGHWSFPDKWLADSGGNSDAFLDKAQGGLPMIARVFSLPSGLSYTATDFMRPDALASYGAVECHLYSPSMGRSAP